MFNFEDDGLDEGIAPDELSPDEGEDDLGVAETTEEDDFDEWN